MTVFISRESMIVQSINQTTSFPYITYILLLLMIFNKYCIVLANTNYVINHRHNQHKTALPYCTPKYFVSRLFLNSAVKDSLLYKVIGHSVKHRFIFLDQNMMMMMMMVVVVVVTVMTMMKNAAPQNKERSTKIANNGGNCDSCSILKLENMFP